MRTQYGLSGARLLGSFCRLRADHLLVGHDVFHYQVFIFSSDSLVKFMLVFWNELLYIDIVSLLLRPNRLDTTIANAAVTLQLLKLKCWNGCLFMLLLLQMLLLGLRKLLLGAVWRLLLLLLQMTVVELLRIDLVGPVTCCALTMAQYSAVLRHQISSSNLFLLPFLWLLPRQSLQTRVHFGLLDESWVARSLLWWSCSLGSPFRCPFRRWLVVGQRVVCIQVSIFNLLALASRVCW